VLGLCGRGETGRLEREKEKNEGVDYRPQLLSVATRKPWEERTKIKIVYVNAIAYCCALLRSTLGYYKDQITPWEKEKKKFEPFIFVAGAPHGVKPSTAANTKGVEWQIPNQIRWAKS
jgi:hypothetical protein